MFLQGVRALAVCSLTFTELSAVGRHKEEELG